jgi:integrase
MRIPVGYKRIAVGMYWNDTDKKIKVLVKRRGATPWTTTIRVENRNEALQKAYAFRNSCLKDGHKPGEPARSGPFSGMPAFREYTTRFGLPGHLNAKTARDQKYVLNRDLLPAFGSLPLDCIGKTELEALQFSLRGKQSPSTVNQKLAIVRKVLRDAHEREVLARVPRFPKALPTRKTVLEVTEADAHKVLAAFASPQSNAGSAGGDYAIFLDEQMRRARWFFEILYATGLAFSDVQSLRWTDVDLETVDPSWHPPQFPVRHINMLVKQRGKTGVLITQKMADRAVTALRQVEGQHAEFCFVTEAGQVYSKTTIDRYFRRAKRLAGVAARFRLHDWRHLAITRWASKGMPVFSIKAAAGHSKIQTSAGYVHALAPEALDAQQTALQA